MEKLRDWKQELRAQLDITGNKKEDLLKIIHVCEEYSQQIKEYINWVSGQIAYVDSIKIQYERLYNIRFDEPPPKLTPQLPLEQITKEVVLTTKEQKRDAIKNTALAISQPDSEFLANDVFEDLTKRGISLGVTKPQNVITTVLASFKTDFAKIPGRKGAFKNITNQKVEEVVNK
jgi:hypothetical protein